MVNVDRDDECGMIYIKMFASARILSSFVVPVGGCCDGWLKWGSLGHLSPDEAVPVTDAKILSLSAPEENF